jgi:predicted nucleotidyltransferase
MSIAERQNAVTDIDSAVKRIVEQFRPVKVILFGSHARGAACPESDVDLLVIMDVKESKRRQAVEIDLALADRTFPLDLIVITPAEFERCRDVVGHTRYCAVRAGKVLYDAGRA